MAKKVKTSNNETSPNIEENNDINNKKKKCSALKNLSKIEKKQRRRFDRCPICFESLGKNPLASTMCGHVYCLSCIEQALKVRKVCPTCRSILRGRYAYHPLYLPDLFRAPK